MRHNYVLIAAKYFTKWVYMILVKHATSEVVCNFLKENIISKFNVLKKIVADNASAFFSSEITEFYFEHGITLSHSSHYYPQGNG